MTVYSLWTNWPPDLLVRMHHLTPPQAANYTWIVPICGYFGAMLGGCISWRLIQRWQVAGGGPQARVPSVRILPARHHGHPAAAHPGARHGRNVIQLLLGLRLEHQSLHAAHRHLRRRPRGLRCRGIGFRLRTMQSIVSRPVAQIIEHYGFQPICFVFSLLPIASYLLVHMLIRDDAGVEMPEVVEAPV